MTDAGADGLLDGYVTRKIQQALIEGREVDVEELKRECPHVSAEKIDQLLRILLVLGPPTRPGGSAIPVIPGFHIIRALGSGGMGTVFLAEQAGTSREVALKRLESPGDPFVEAPFEEEVKALASLNHPNIVQVYEWGEDESGVPYYAMEYVPGVDLRVAIAELKRIRLGEPSGQFGAPIPAEVCHLASGYVSNSSRGRREYFRTVARLGAQAARALQHAHDHGVIHRDVKPSNLMLGFERGELYIKVTDFGLSARKGATGAAEPVGRIGTLAYMSPEQNHGDMLVTERSDVFSLGVTLYELLTLRRAFEAPTAEGLHRKIQYEDPVPPRAVEPDIRWDLEAIIMKAVRKKTLDRYGSVVELADDLDDFLEDRPVAAARGSLPRRLAKWRARNRELLRYGGAAALVALVVLLVGLVIHQDRLAAEERRTAAERDAARAAREVSDRERRAAEEARLLARRNLYRAHMLLAAQALKEEQVGRAFALLESHQPGPGGPDLRGWEWYYLDALCHRDDLTLKGPAEYMGVLAWSPDGRFLAGSSGGAIGSMRQVHNDLVAVWDATTGRQVTVFAGPPGGGSIDWTGESKLLLVSPRADEGRGRVSLWDRGANKIVAERTPGERGETFLRGGLAPGPEPVLVAASPEKLTVRNALSGAVIATFPLPRGDDKDLQPVPVASAAVSRDGKRIAVPFLDGSVRVAEPAKGKEWRVLRGHSRPVGVLAWSPDGKYLATFAADQTLRVWSPESGEEKASLRIAANSTATPLAWSPDANRVAIGLLKRPEDMRGGTRLPLLLWDFQKKQEVRFPGPATDTFAWSPDGKHLALASPQDVVEIRDAATGDVVNRLRGHTGPLLALSWNPEGTRLATGAFDGTARVWSPFAPQDAAAYRGATAGSLRGHLSWSAGGRQLAVTGPGRSVVVLDGATAQEVHNLSWPAEPDAGRHDGATCVAWSPDGKYLAATGAEGTLVTWDAESLARKHVLPGAGSWLSWSPDGRRLVSAAPQEGAPAASRITLWDPVTGEAEQSVGARAWSASSYDPSRLTAWHAATGRFLFADEGVVRELGPGRDAPGPVIAAKGVGHWDLLSPDGTWAVQSESGRKFLLTTPDAAAPGTFAVPQEALSASGDGRYLIAHTHTEEPRHGFLVDTRTGKAVPLNWLPDTSGDFHCAWSPDGTRLAGGFPDGLVLMWEVTTGEVTLSLRGHETAVYELAWSPNGRRLASLDEAGTVRVWDATAGYER